MPRKAASPVNPHAPGRRDQQKFLRDLVERLAVDDKRSPKLRPQVFSLTARQAAWLAKGLELWLTNEAKTLEKALGLTRGAGAPLKSVSKVDPRAHEAFAIWFVDPDLTATQVASRVGWDKRPDELLALVRRHNQKLELAHGGLRRTPPGTKAR